MQTDSFHLPVHMATDCLAALRTQAVFESLLLVTHSCVQTLSDRFTPANETGV